MDTAGRRIAYGPVAAGDVASLFDAGFLDGGAHATYLGPTDEIPWLARQQRLTFARVGVVDPLSADDYVRHGGPPVSGEPSACVPQEIVDELAASGLRGRGGAGFPAGIKWQTVVDTPPVSEVRLLQRRRG